MGVFTISDKGFLLGKIIFVDALYVAIYYEYPSIYHTAA